MSNILEKILEHKRKEVAERASRLPLEKIKQLAGEAPYAPVRFSRALRRTGDVALIAEIKKRSPSKGLIKHDFDLEQTVIAYREAGADAISVLTDSEFFGGAPEFLAGARQLTQQPLLRKDFIIDPYQVYEARYLGADAVLLIVAALDGKKLKELIELAYSLGMEALVETRTREEIETALEAGASIIGINNRDLRTFQVDLKTTRDLIGYINKKDITVVSESGIKTRADVLQLGSYGADAVLVGEAIMAYGDLQEGVRMLKGASSSTKPVAEV